MSEYEGLIAEINTCIPSLEDRQLLTRAVRLLERDVCLQKVEPTEPMFVLLARDSTAPEVIEKWCSMRAEEIRQGVRPDTAEEREHIETVMRKITEFAVWRMTNRTS